jgi:predicted negative regulator of RcsB-dependent stress response
MKKILVAIMFGFMAIAAQAEATFDQVQTLIQQHEYQAAATGLEVIIQNHPKSAKAFYAMAQAQAGLGNLEKAQKALNIATGLNPTLDFAPASSVASLKEAITPQVKKIETIEESHALRNFVLFAMFAGFAVAMYFIYSVYARKQEEEEKELAAKLNAEAEERLAKRKREHMEMLAKQDAERKAELAAEAALKAHPNYGHERFDPANPDKLKSVKQFKEEKLAEEMVAKARAEAELAAEARRQRLRAEAAEDEARRARMTYSQPSPTVVNNSNNDLLTGVILGNMMSSHHDTTRVVEREVVRETPSRSSRDSSWDDTPSRSSSSSRSSSWDDDSSSSSSSSRSSSWDSSSSSSSSSSWDSSSSSSDSSSSSSWD